MPRRCMARMLTTISGSCCDSSRKLASLPPGVWQGCRALRGIDTTSVHELLLNYASTLKYRSMKSDEASRSGGTGYRLPLLPLRDIIVFPHMVVPLYVGREKSLSALEEAMAGDKQLLLAAQRRPKTDDPASEDIFAIGTVGHIIQLLRFPKGPVKVLVEGRARARIRGFHQTEPFFVCDVEDVDESDDDHVQIQALMRSVQDVFDDYAKLNTRIPPE